MAASRVALLRDNLGVPQAERRQKSKLGGAKVPSPAEAVGQQLDDGRAFAHERRVREARTMHANQHARPATNEAAASCEAWVVGEAPIAQPRACAGD